MWALQILDRANFLVILFTANMESVNHLVTFLTECVKIYDNAKDDENYTPERRRLSIEVHKMIEVYDTHDDPIVSVVAEWLYNRDSDRCQRYHLYLAWFAMRQLLLNNFEIPSYDDIVDFAVTHPHEVVKCFSDIYDINDITIENSKDSDSFLPMFLYKMISVTRKIRENYLNQYDKPTEYPEDIPVDFMHITVNNDITDNENTVLLDILNTYMSAFFNLAVDMLEDRKRKQKKYTSENIDKFVSTLNTLKDRLSK